MNDISIDESLRIKGIAMIFIVLHNFLHLISGVKENEMSFDFDRINTFFESVANTPTGTPNFVISFLGAYFVQIFITLSAYGLTRKAIASGQTNYKLMAIPPILKVYSLIFPVFAFYSLLNLFIDVSGGGEGIAVMFLNEILFLLMAYNFSYDTLFGSPIPVLSAGPWWFCFLIIQLYLLFPIFFFIVKKIGSAWWLIVVIAYIFIYAALPFSEAAGFPIFANAPGHLPEFIFGIALAMYPAVRVRWWHALVGLIVFCLSITNSWTFPLTFLSSSIVILFCCRHFLRLTENCRRCQASLLFFGNASMFMFIVNAQVRNITLRLYENTHPLIMLAGGCIHLGLVLLVAFLYGYVYHRKIKKHLIFITNKLVGQNAIKECL